MLHKYLFLFIKRDKRPFIHLYKIAIINFIDQIMFRYNTRIVVDSTIKRFIDSINRRR